MKNKIDFKFTVIVLFSIITLSSYAQNQDSLIVKKHIEQGGKYRIEGEYEKARKYALKALEIDPNYGMAYILIGVVYANSAKLCGEEYFSQAMVYCLAVDMFEKAIEVDKSITEEAIKFIDAFSPHFPSREIHFWEIKEGDKFNIGCWINRETTVRFAPE